MFATYQFDSTVSKSWKTIALIAWFIFFFVFLFRTTQIEPDPGVIKRLIISFLYGLGLEFGATYFAPDKGQNEWKSHFGLSVHLGKWLNAK